MAETRLSGRGLGLAAVGASALVLGLDITILITALPTLSAKLGATTDQLQWMSAAYTLSLAGFMLPAGVLGDRVGRKRLLLIGLVVFGVSSVVASRMTSADGLILMGVSEFWQIVIKGVVIVTAVILDQMQQRYSRRAAAALRS